MNKRIICLEILDWSSSIGGEHFSGVLWSTMPFDGENVPIKKTLEYPMTPSLAARFNLKAQRDMPSFQHHYGTGDITDRFESEKELREFAVREYKKFSPDSDILLVGGYCIADPQECLDGPLWFKNESNRLWKAFRQVGGYEGDEKACDGIFLEYQKVLKKLNDGIDKPEGL